MEHDDFVEWKARRDRILRNLDNMTNDDALMYWPPEMLFPTDTEFGALAAYHKARLMWTKASEQMKESSRKWLVEHGYKPTVFGIIPT